MGWINKKKAIEKAEEVCKNVGLTVSPLTLIKDLSIAQKQMVEIAKAIMMEVQILVLDEPTATLTETEIEKLFGIIRDLKSKGVGIIYISHRMKELKEIGDRCTVLRDGCYIDTVDLKQTSPDQLIKMMVGRAITFEKKKDCCSTEEETLCIKDLSLKNILTNVSFSLKKGEVLGVAGIVGSGRTELAKCIIGEYTRSSGSINLKGKPINNRSPGDAIKNGIVYLSEDRKGEGLILKHDVKENVCIASLSKVEKRRLLSKSKIKSLVTSLVAKLAIKTPSIHVVVENLSGGNQQKVVIAKWLLAEAEVYIFDEPTRGIDVGSREEIYRIMEQLVVKGASVIMISSDLVEILRMSDKVLIMCNGSVAAILDNNEDLKQEEILNYAIGGNC
jgi:ribose transport system ATP-binding protein